MAHFVGGVKDCFDISVQFSSVVQSCPTLCGPMDCSMPDLPVHHQLPDSTQTQNLWVGDAIQLSHPLSLPSSLAFNLSQHQGLFEWVSSEVSLVMRQESWRRWTNMNFEGSSRRNSRIYPRFPPQLEKNHETFPSPQDEHQVAKVLEFQLQHQSFQWIFRTDFL